MKGIQNEEILDASAYAGVREAFRAQIIKYKQSRRVAVGPSLTFLFENRRTVRWQIQEMVYVERIVDREAVAAEVEVYNELIPGPAELSATLMVEIPDSTRIRPELDRLIGIDEHVFLEVGAEQVRATFDAKQFEADRISAVQYVRFSLGPDLAARFADPGVTVALRVEHPAYRARVELERDLRDSLAQDLRAP